MAQASKRPGLSSPERTQTDGSAARTNKKRAGNAPAPQEHDDRAAYLHCGPLHSGFAQFAAFDQDAIDNRTFLARGRLKLPILAVGGQKSFGPMMATVMRAAGDDVTEGIVPDSGHWIMEENPQATIKLVRGFLVP